MQSPNLIWNARRTALSLYAECPRAPAFVQVMEWVARYKTINYMVMSTQDCEYYDGKSIETDGNSIW